MKKVGFSGVLGMLVEALAAGKPHRHKIFKHKSTSEQLGGASEYEAFHRLVYQRDIAYLKKYYKDFMGKISKHFLVLRFNLF